MKMTAKQLDERLDIPGAALIRWDKRIGVVFRIGENLSMQWQSGDLIVLWADGDHTVLHSPGGNGIHEDTEVEVLIADLFSDKRYEKFHPETVWPTVEAAGELEHKLRYPILHSGRTRSREDELVMASVMSAYRYLRENPGADWKQRIDALRIETEKATELYGQALELSQHTLELATKDAAMAGVTMVATGAPRLTTGLELAKQVLASLTDDDRLEAISEFCKECGCDQPTGKCCQCWNDE